MRRLVGWPPISCSMGEVPWLLLGPGRFYLSGTGRGAALALGLCLGEGGVWVLTDLIRILIRNLISGMTIKLTKMAEVWFPSNMPTAALLL